MVDSVGCKKLAEHSISLKIQIYILLIPAIKLVDCF
jgi:hypothetical protein